ncbi:MAG: Maf family protein [Coriobacteriia bacterium]|nr:Maf family protein [Coriobacteriia bacterium]
MASYGPRIVLASFSPRRRRLLACLGIPFEACAVDTPEDISGPLANNPSALAAHLAVEKALAARTEGIGPGALILAFDTIVVADGVLLGKPTDESDARRMLRMLSGESHQVVTGAALLAPGDSAPASFAVTSNVSMRKLPNEQIDAWLASDEYVGCAGAYNIEKNLARVDSLECHQNVCGLPLCHLYCELSTRYPRYAPGIVSPVAACDQMLGRSCGLGAQMGCGS